MSNVLIGIIEVLLILEEIILGTGITDVYQMIRNQFTPYRIVLKILTRTNIHSPIDLSTIGTDNLSLHAYRHPTREESMPLICEASAAARLVFPLAVGPNMVIIECFMVAKIQIFSDTDKQRNKKNGRTRQEKENQYAFML